MATTLSTIYPPQVETFMPSFCYNEPAVIWFKISSYNEDIKNKIKYIHVSIVDQRNNQNVLESTKNSNTSFPQYYPISFSNNSSDMGYDSNKKMYWLSIPPTVIKTSPFYNPNQYYKIQLRFDLTGDQSFPGIVNYDNPTTFWNNADALGLSIYTNYNQNNFSEWSTGTLIKPILIPNLSLNFVETDFENQNPVINYINKSTDEPVFGILDFGKDDNDTNSYKDNNEWLSWYQIKIIDSNNNNLIRFDSGKKYNNNIKKENEINDVINTKTLSTNINYILKVTYETNNGYNHTVDYLININEYSDNDDIPISYEKIIDEEKGAIILTINGLISLDGYLIIRRSSHRSNFCYWDLIAAYNLSSLEENQNSLTIIDNTIESMTGYRYQLQRYTKDNNNNVTMYKPQYIEDDDILHCDFYGGLFWDGKKTLKVSFNFQPSNRANAMNRTKTDTLGGQYPIFTQNPKLKYHTYNITGRISTEDNGELFLSKEEVFGLEYYNYRYNDDIEIKDTSYFGGASGRNISHNTKKIIQSNQDWLYEREYRDAVEEWLNNGKPKLFRSMTEGNLIVMLDSVSLVPDMVLGRRLYDFNATMYEIGNGKDINEIASFGLFDIVDER